MGHLSNPIGLRLFANRFSSFLWSSSRISLLSQQDFLIFDFLNFFFKLNIFKNLNCIFFNFKILRHYNNLNLNIFVYDFNLFSFFDEIFFSIRKYKFFRNYFSFHSTSLNNFIFYYYSFAFRFNKFSKIFYFLKLNPNLRTSLSLKFSKLTKYFRFKNYFIFILKKLNNLKHFNNSNFLIKRFSNPKALKLFYKIIGIKKKFLNSFKNLKPIFFKIVRFLLFNKLKFIFEKKFFYFLKKFLLFNLYKFIHIRSNIFCNFLFFEPSYLDSKFLVQYLIFRLNQKIPFKSIFYKTNNILTTLLSKQRLLGFKISLKGRFSRKQRASFLWKRVNRVPLNSKMSYIDYSSGHVILRYGMCSIKIWLNFSQEFSKKKIFFII